MTLEKEHGHHEYTDQDDAFYAILGSVLGKVAHHMMMDHRAAIGYKVVDRIVLLGKENTGDHWTLARTFLLLLSEPRLPRRASSEPPPPEPERRRRRMSL